MYAVPSPRSEVFIITERTRQLRHRGVIRVTGFMPVTSSQSQGNSRVDRAHVEGRSVAGLRL